MFLFYAKFSSRIDYVRSENVIIFMAKNLGKGGNVIIFFIKKLMVYAIGVNYLQSTITEY